MNETDADRQSDDTPIIVRWLRKCEKEYWNDIHDPRTKDYPFMDRSPWLIIGVLLLYLLLVTRIIPGFMKNRKPFELRRPMFIYNCVMVAINLHYFIKCFTTPGLPSFLDFRYPLQDDVSPETLTIISQGYFYMLSKWMDLIDTFLFCLRKKDSHITFLHLYHHTMVPLFGFIFMKLNVMIPAGTLFALLNTFVHVVMYSYYALAAFGPKIQPYLWWKKYITMLQLSQFLILFVYASILFVFQTGYPKVWLYIGCCQPPFFFYMFYDFYKRSYTKNKKNKDDGKDSEKIKCN